MSGASSERNFSTHSHFHSTVRSSLEHDKVGTLIFLKTNHPVFWGISSPDYFEVNKAPAGDGKTFTITRYHHLHPDFVQFQCESDSHQADIDREIWKV